jgi:hypothetical protein
MAGTGGQGSGGDNTGTACADGSVEAAEDKFGRSDIAYCRNAVDEMPSATEADALCAAGWHVCTLAEWYERNDDCDDAVVPFGARLGAAGDNCAVAHWTGDARYVCSADTAEDIATHSCSGDVSSTSWSTQEFPSSAACKNTTNVAGGCGTLCCPD